MKKIPVEKGDEVKVKVEAEGAKGDGISKVDGFVVIVAKPIIVGFTYKVRITNVGLKYAFAEVI